MPIQDVHLLIAQARVEADNPEFKVEVVSVSMMVTWLNVSLGLFPSVCLHWKKINSFPTMMDGTLDGRIAAFQVWVRYSQRTDVFDVGRKSTENSHASRFHI